MFYNHLKTLYDYDWATAGYELALESPRPAGSPKKIIDQSASDLLTDRVSAALDRLVAIAEQTASKRFIPISRIEIRGYVDPEESTEEIVVRIWTKVGLKDAYKFWDYLGIAVEDAIRCFPGGLQRVAVERISFEVECETTDLAV
jgi:hypothetical protein